MEFIGKPINNCYLLQENLGENEIFSTWRAKAMYSPNNFSISFFNFLQNDPPKSVLQSFEDLFFRIYNFDNSYILAPFEYSSYENTRFIASNWIEGYSLRQVMDKGLITNFDQVMNIVIFLLRGLSSLERAGMHHNSLSPRAIVVPDANIEYGRIKLRNIGVSLFVDAFPEGRYVQKIKPYYLPAQQYPDGPQRDLYATAVITMELLQLVGENDGNPEQKATIREIFQKIRKNPESFSSVDELLNTIIRIHPEKELIDHLNDHAQARLEAQDYSDILKRIRSNETISSEQDYAPPNTRQQFHRSPLEPFRNTPSPDGDFFPEGGSPPPEREGFISRVVSAFQRLISGRKGKNSGGRRRKEDYVSSDEPELLIPLEEELEAPDAGASSQEKQKAAGYTQSITGSLYEPDTDIEARSTKVAEILRKLQDHFSGLTSKLNRNDSTSRIKSKKAAPVLPIDENRHTSGKSQNTPLSENFPPNEKTGPEASSRNINGKNSKEISGHSERESGKHPGFTTRKAGPGEEYLFGDGTPDLTGEFLELEGDGALGEGSEYEKARINTDREDPEKHETDKSQLITGDLHNRSDRNRTDRNLTHSTDTGTPANPVFENTSSGSMENRQHELGNNAEEKVSGGQSAGNSDNRNADEEQLSQDSILPPPVGEQGGKSAEPSGKKGFFARLKLFVKKLIRRITGPFR